MEKRVAFFAASLAVVIALSCVFFVSIFIVWRTNLPKETVREVWAGGDGEGFNLKIELFGNKYRAVWHGCFGEYGRAEGDYVKSADHIRFSPTVETGMTMKRIRSMQIVQNEGQDYLIDDDDKDAIKYLRYSALKRIVEPK